MAANTPPTGSAASAYPPNYPDSHDPTPPHHETKMDTIPGVEPRLFGAVCFTCGWESESLWSDPEAAEEAAADHEREASRAAA